MTSPDHAGDTPVNDDSTTTPGQPSSAPSADGPQYSYVVRRKREPRLLRIVLIFALLGVIGFPLVSYLTGETTSSDLAYFILFGGLIGGLVGGILALILDRLARGK